MARGSKINFNRKAVDTVVLAIADGALEWGKQTVEAVGETAPDAPPLNEGLPKQGGVLAYFDGKKIGQFGLDGKTPRVPRAARISRTRGLVLILGWGFPARFNEFGTAKMAAQPFFASGVHGMFGRFVEIAGAIVKGKLGSAP